MESIRAAGWVEIWRKGMAPTTPWKKRNLPHIWRGVKKVFLSQLLHIPYSYGEVWLKVGEEDLGLVSLQVITTAGSKFVADSARNIGAMSQIRFHGLGKGSAPESITDIGLGVELNTELTPAGQRAFGSLAGTAGTNIFQTVGINTLAAPVVITEFGIFTQQPVGTPILVDRTVYAPQAANAGIAVTSIYNLIVPAGG